MTTKKTFHQIFPAAFPEGTVVNNAKIYSLFQDCWAYSYICKDISASLERLKLFNEGDEIHLYKKDLFASLAVLAAEDALKASASSDQPIVFLFNQKSRSYERFNYDSKILRTKLKLKLRKASEQ
jgi:hypothetical protein